MTLALECAKAAADAGEVPIGAVILDSAGAILSLGQNRTIRDLDPTAHAEIVAIRAACAKLGNEGLEQCDLYVTLEPCAMCAGAISMARIRRLYFGAADEKGGAVEHGPRFFSAKTCHHAPEIYGAIGEDEAQGLLRDFFRSRR